MPFEDPDLRRLLDHIGRLPDADSAAILSGLTPRQRELALKLLNAPAKVRNVGNASELALSPWLSELLAQSEALAPLARAALRDCAERLGHERSDQSSSIKPSNLFEQLRSGKAIGKALTWRD